MILLEVFTIKVKRIFKVTIVFLHELFMTKFLRVQTMNRDKKGHCQLQILN